MLRVRIHGVLNIYTWRKKHKYIEKAINLIPEPRDPLQPFLLADLLFWLRYDLFQYLLNGNIFQSNVLCLFDQLPSDVSGSHQRNVPNHQSRSKPGRTGGTHKYAVMKPAVDQLPLVKTAKPFIRMMMIQKNNAMALE
jgi:hypothetical protein